MTVRDANRVPFVPGHSMAVVMVAFAAEVARPLLVDTGALMTTMSVATAHRLDLDLDLERPTRWRHLVGIDGIPRRVPVVNPGRLALGGMVIPLSEVAVTHLPAGFRADGLLGLNVLLRFRITFEFDTRHLLLRPTV